MRTEHLLISLAALVLSFLLCGVGFFLFFFPEAIVNVRLWGLIFFSFGVALLATFSLLTRRRYLLIKMGGVSIHEKLLRHFASETLRELFPHHKIACDVTVHRKGRVEIMAQIPYLSEERQEQKLEEIEQALSAAFLKYCGWKEPFIFNVSFS